MRPSLHAREQLGGLWHRLYLARELFLRWFDRQWWWIAPLLLFFLYLLVGHFDTIGTERRVSEDRYQQILVLQARLDAELRRGSWSDPAYFVVQAATPREASDKLLALTGYIGAERIELLHQSDVESK